MLERDLEVISSYFRELSASSPMYNMEINEILMAIDAIKMKIPPSLGTSILIPRRQSNQCTICKKMVICDE